MAGRGESIASNSSEGHALVRREFLNYAWLASLGFLWAVGFGGAAYFFSFPRFKVGEFGGIFFLGLAGDVLPGPSDPPIHNHDGRFWLSNVGGTIAALYDACVHLGCLHQWQSLSGRFECLCHGSEFQRDGTYVEGPALRCLDRMAVSLADYAQRVVASTDEHGNPLSIPTDAGLQGVLDAGRIIRGAARV